MIMKIENSARTFLFSILLFDEAKKCCNVNRLLVLFAHKIARIRKQTRLLML